RPARRDEPAAVRPRRVGLGQRRVVRLLLASRELRVSSGREREADQYRHHRVAPRPGAASRAFHALSPVSACYTSTMAKAVESVTLDDDVQEELRKLAERSGRP